MKGFFILKFLQHNNDFKVSVRKHSELSFDALFTKIGQRAAEKLHLKPTLILHVLLHLDWLQSASRKRAAYTHTRTLPYAERTRYCALEAE